MAKSPANASVKKTPPPGTLSAHRQSLLPETDSAQASRYREATLVIVTGMSGSGKGSVLKVFEDLNYYCVDNLPVDLIRKFAELCQTSPEITRAALVVDIREGEALRRFPALLRRLRQQVLTLLVFLEAGEEALLRRFSETRRPHPLGLGLPLREEIAAERKMLQPIRKLAGLVIDTIRFNLHHLRNFIADRFAGPTDQRSLLIGCVSFGYRHGLPQDSDLVFDVRFLPNPNYIPKLNPLSGKDRAVVNYIRSFPQPQEIGFQKLPGRSRQHPQPDRTAPVVECFTRRQRGVAVQPFPIFRKRI